MKDKTRIFIHSIFLSDDADTNELREYLNSHTILEHTQFSQNADGTLKVTLPTRTQQNFSLNDTAFSYFVAEKIFDGYVYGFLGSLKEILN